MAVNSPAMHMPLRGKALIEASAGTGKTWTLTGILLRLLLEEPDDGERLPKQIIATTFTRKAAAEMRHRVQARFDSFFCLASNIAGAYSEDPEILADDGELSLRLSKQLDDWQSGTDKHLADASSDEINRYILRQSAEQGLDGLIRLFQRCDARQQDIDDLFIGTLDSLCQRWLGEFALETGSDNHVTLLEDETKPVEVLVRNHLREKYARMPMEILQRLQKSSKITTDYVEDIQKNLSFTQAEIEPVMASADRLLAILDERERIQQSKPYRQAITALQALAVDDITTYQYYIQTELAAKMPKNKKIFKFFTGRNLSVADFRRQLLQEYAGCDENWQFILELLQGEVRFNKGGESTYDAFSQHFITVLLQQLVEPYCHRQDELATIEARLLPELLAETFDVVRERLPAYLEKNASSTFSEQIGRLNRALEGCQGSVLAKYIAHHYPIILVDESQDLNNAQAQLLENIYFPYLQSHGFLLLVGDPKQAIYRFRGGDVANYLRLKKQFSPDERFSLSENFRSASALISGLNALYYQCNMLGEDIFYEPMQSGADASRTVVTANGKTVSQPIHWFQTTATEELDDIVQLVLQLTSPQSVYARVEKNGQPVCLRKCDIMVLLRNNNKINILQDKLQRKGIDTEFSKTDNIFTQSVAQEISALLYAMINPQDKAGLRRLLSGIFFAQTREDLERLQNEEGDDGRLNMLYLSKVLQQAGEIWQQKQLLAGLQYFLTVKFSDVTIWERLARYASPEKERYLLDLRQIQQIIADKSGKMLPTHFLRWWQNHLQYPPQNEWAKMMPLPGKDAVRLLTIHGAKGLESPVVIVGGMGSVRADTAMIYTYHDGGQTVISTLPKDRRKQQLNQERDDELRRLLYVALTRPSDLLFIAVQKNKDTYLFPPLDSLKPFETMATVASHQMLPSPPAIALQSTYSLTLGKDDMQLPMITMQEYDKKTFYGWQKSSFSALSRHVDMKKDEFAVDAADFTLTKPLPLTTPVARKAVQYRFPRGANPGSFLHHILEDIEPVQHRNFERVLQKYARRYVLPEWGKNEELREWIHDILKSSLISGSSLEQIPPSERVNEMNFSLAVDLGKSFDLQALNEIVRRWGKKLNLQDKKMAIGFLRGEIDVCYQHDGRYYILDYKSNYLGDSASDYNDENMQKAMSEHHYWLQALIYQTALHRWLKKRLRGYQPVKHLGAVEYFFLRGCGIGTASDGHFKVDVPVDILLEFDQFL